MELVVYVNTPVGEESPNIYIGENWEQIFKHIGSDDEKQELSNKVEEILEEKYNLQLGEVGDIYRAIYEAETIGEAMALFKADIQKALVYMREEALPEAYWDDSFLDHVTDFCEQVAQMIYQYHGLGKKELINDWANNMKESRYFEGEISEYMSTSEEIDAYVKSMNATAIGPFHDNLVSIGLVRLTINEILENGK